MYEVYKINIETITYKIIKRVITKKFYIDYLPYIHISIIDIDLW